MTHDRALSDRENRLRELDLAVNEARRKHEAAQRELNPRVNKLQVELDALSAKLRESAAAVTRAEAERDAADRRTRRQAIDAIRSDEELRWELECYGLDLHDAVNDLRNAKPSKKLPDRLEALTSAIRGQLDLALTPDPLEAVGKLRRELGIPVVPRQRPAKPEPIVVGADD